MTNKEQANHAVDAETASDTQLIWRIVNRAVDTAEQCQGHAATIDKHALASAITSAHLVYGLDLVGLVNARGSDLVHDVFGIRRNWNPQTCELDNCFLPRYSN